jgi:hypothetical protein
MLAGTGGIPWTTRLALGTMISPGGDVCVDGRGAQATNSVTAAQAAANRATRMGMNGIGMKKGAASAAAP